MIGRPLRANGSLPRHGDAHALLGGDQMVGILGIVAEVDLDSINSSGERVVAGGVVVADRGCGVDADIEGLVQGEEKGDSGVDPPAAGLGAVEVEVDGAALAGAAAVVGELDADLVLSGWHLVRAIDLELLDA